MIGHIGINVPDLGAAKRYYGSLMPLVGFTLFFETEDECAFRPADNKPGTFIFFYPIAEDGYSPERPGLQHLAFMVRTRALVDRVHDLVKESGGEVIYEPREFPQYPGPYYATFWRDPFGFKLEAVCHHDR